MPVRHLLGVLGVLGAGLLLAPPPVAAGDFVQCADHVPGQYVVVFDTARLPPASRDRQDALRDHAVAVQAPYGGRIGHVYASALQGYSVAGMTETQARAVAAHPLVRAVEEDCILRPSIMVTQNNAPWHLDRIDEREHALDGKYTYSKTGKGVNAYVLDHLARASHKEYDGRMKSRVRCIEADYSGNCVPPSNPKVNDHATAIASLIGGVEVGVAKEVSLHSVEVCESKVCPASAVIAGVNYVRHNHVKPAVVNLSINYRGGYSTNCWPGYNLEEGIALPAAIRSLIDAGVTVTISAGNCGDNACNYPPANTREALVVGATEIFPINGQDADVRAYFSNFGSCVDLLAPGEDIRAARASGYAEYRNYDGTSYSAPLVAGLAALYLDQYPNASPASVASFLTSTALAVVREAGSGVPANPNLLLYSTYGRQLE